MNQYKTILFGIVSLLPLAAICGPVTAEFTGVDDFTDFSVSGLSEQKTLKMFQNELDSELERIAKKYLSEGQSLELVFTDIDMAGDIQPWRNRHNADIRYVEAVYPPRLKFTYTLKNAQGEILKQGEAAESDMAFQMKHSMNVRRHGSSFGYELELLNDWARKTLRKDSPVAGS